jgi:hypothetical protein
VEAIVEAAGLPERQDELDDSYCDEDGTEDEVEHWRLCRPIGESLSLSSNDWLTSCGADQPDGKRG